MTEIFAQKRTQGGRDYVAENDYNFAICQVFNRCAFFGEAVVPDASTQRIRHGA
jgi:hypothetical protein